MASDKTGQARSGSTTHQPGDPETIVREIEAAREDLAQTLDAIADRVSPKRVTERGKARAKEVATQAKEVASEKAAQAREALSDAAVVAKERAASAKEQAQEKAAAAKHTAQEKAHQAQAAMSHDGSPGSSGAPASVLDADPEATEVHAVAGTGAPVPVLTTRGSGAGGPGTAAGGGTSGSGSALDLLAGVPREALVGAGAALVVLWLLLRRRD